jgi:hypothetical protein
VRRLSRRARIRRINARVRHNEVLKNQAERNTGNGTPETGLYIHIPALPLRSGETAHSEPAMRRLLAVLCQFSVLTLLSATVAPAPADAGEPRVVTARAVASADGTWRFDVTLRHGDSGWDHYADRWEILDGAGKILASRVLLHPHETEQPFTRSLTGVKLPPGLARVGIRAHDKRHGNGSVIYGIDLPKKGS